MTDGASVTTRVSSVGHARLADAIRALATLSAASDLDETAANDAADALEAALEALRAKTKPTVHSHETGYPRGFLERSTVSGALNPIAPPMRLALGETVVGEVEYGAAYEGAPGCVHGGHVALAFDHVAGRVATRVGPVLTGKLRVRYVKPTRLHRTIRYEATLRSSRHRLVTVDCVAYDGDTRTASAEVIFVELSPAYMAEVLGAS